MATRNRARARARTTRRRNREGGDQFKTYNVRVGFLPGKVFDIVLNGDHTVQAAIDGAELGDRIDDGAEVRVNGEPTELDKELKEGDVVLLINQIQGN